MIKLINQVTGTEMYVHESRLEEYLAKGHTLAPPPPPPPKASARKPATKSKK